MNTQLQNKCAEMPTTSIVDCLLLLNKRWDQYTAGERKVRSHLLSEYEAREGGEAVDRLMDQLDLALGESIIELR